MTRDEIRTHMFTFFKKCSSDDFQSVCNYKGQTLIQSVRDLFRNMMPEYNHLEEAKTNPIILEIINEWVSNGLLAFGNKNDLDAQSFGYISVTSYGEECFQNEII